MNFKNYSEVRKKAANIRAVYGNRYDRGIINKRTFEKMMDITSDMKNNPHKFTNN